MPQDVSDGELMSRFYNGDTTAFDDITERWWKRLFGFFRKRGLSAEDSEECALETLIKLFLTRETLSFDSQQPLGPFLFRTAYHLSIQEWRQKQRRGQSLSWLDGFDDRAAPGPLPRSTMEDLSLCIRSLPEPEQTYLLLCRKHGVGELEHQEIAEVLERSPARVTQISQSAIRRMRECMGVAGPHAAGCALTAQGKRM